MRISYPIASSEQVITKGPIIHSKGPIIHSKGPIVYIVENKCMCYNEINDNRYQLNQYPLYRKRRYRTSTKKV